MVRKLAILSIATWAASTVVFGQAVDANKVLTDMRAAIGGDEKIAAVRSLTADDATRLPMSKSTMVSETNLALALPDKYVVRSMLTPMFNVTYRTSGFNGTGVITQTDVPPVLNNRVMVRTPGMIWPFESLTPAQRDSLLREAKHDFARTALGLFGSSFEAFPLRFSYAGQEDLPQGTAHVIHATGDDKFDVRLFVDTRTHLPVMTRPKPR